MKSEDSALASSLLQALQAVRKLLVWLCSLPIPCSSSLCGCVPFLFAAQAPCVAVFPSYSLLKLLVWLCSLPIRCCSSSLCGCVPFLFPAQAPCVAVFPSYSLLKLLVWLCSLPIPCSSSLCSLISPCLAVTHTALFMHVTTIG